MAKMKRSKIVWLIVAASLTVLGLLAIAFSIAASGFDFLSFGTTEYESNSYEIEETFRDISIKTNTADITVKRSDDETARVVCREESKLKHSVSVEDGALIIEMVDARKWYEHIKIGISFEGASITVYLPDGAYGDLLINVDTGDTEIQKDILFEDIDIDSDTGDVTNYAWATGTVKIKTTTGDITVGDAYAGTLDLAASTGKMNVKNVNCAGEIKQKSSTGKAFFEDVNCKSMTSVANTGDITLTCVKVLDRLAVERSTGDVRFDGSDAAEIVIETDTGDVTGSLLSDKIFFVTTDTGDVDVPESISGGKCKVTTDTGDVRLTVK